MEAAQHPWPALGVLLVRDGLVSKDELQEILVEQHDERHKRISGHQLGELLVARGTVTPTQIARLVAEQYELPFLELEVNDLDVQVARVLEREISERLGAIPVTHKPDGSYVLAIADPSTVLFSDELRRALGSATHFTVVGPEAIEAALAFVWEGRAHVVPETVEPPDAEALGVVVELHPVESIASATGAPAAQAHAGPPLGALLLREGLVTEDQLDQALAQQSLSTSWRLGEILVDRGVVTTAVVARMIAEQYELPYYELELLRVDPAVATLLPRDIARTFPAVPVAVFPDGTIELAIADPANFSSSDELRSALDAPLTLVVAAPDAIEALIDASHTAMTAVEEERSEEPEWHDSASSPVEPEAALEAPATLEYLEHVAEAHELPEYVVDFPATPATDFQFAPADPPTFDHQAPETVDLDADVNHQPEFFTEPMAVDEPQVLGDAPADEPFAVEEHVDSFATWPAELRVADPIEVAAPGDQSNDASETNEAVAEELTAALLAEVGESYDSSEPEYHSANEDWFARSEVEQTEDTAVTEAAVEMTEPEAAPSVAEVGGSTSESDDPRTPDRFPSEDWFALGEDDAEDTAVREAVVEPAEPAATLSLVEPPTPRLVYEAPTPPDELVVDDPAASAPDLDSAIDEVVALGASAIHFSPQGDWHTVRARIDGLVRDLGVVASEDIAALIERVGASAAVRVDVVPTKQGDKFILFPREQAGAPRTLGELGLTGEATETLRSALALPSGAIVVCGPVGSGTTTTLYASLEAFATPERVVASIEDPVERVLEGVDQIEVDEGQGVTFASGLHTLLTTDCDGVLVGDVRDPETAGIAIQAALDGRYVLAGVRAPSAATAILRLATMHVDPHVLGAAVTHVVAQRLVRRICADCRETYYASEPELAELGQLDERSGPRLLARGRGCEACDGTGFRGRTGLFEILTVTEEIRTLVADRAAEEAIQRAAVAAGMRTLRDEGVRLCLEGVTTAQEIQRVLGAER
ncbi:MAG: ATPase, T2SS/T4P/T4SS family [Gaiellaceae bacterium]